MSDDKKYNQYFSTRPRVNITMPNGKRISFIAGSYVTDAQDEIAFLDEQIRLGLQVIYTKKGQETVTAESLDPLAAIKKKAIDEYLAAQQAQADPDRDMGDTGAKGANPTLLNSKSIAAVTVNSKSK